MSEHKSKIKRLRLAKPEMERPRLRCRHPKPDPLEPADYTFTWLLQEIRLAKQIREHWHKDDSIVRGSHRIERERWQHLIRAFGPDVD